MPNIINVDDSFTSLAVNTTLHFRTPEVQYGTSVWTVEGATSNVIGGGSGDIKFNISGAACKINAGIRDCAVQATIIPGNDDEFYSVTMRDYQTTAYPREGYLLSVRIRPSQATGLFSVGYIINYAVTYINENVVWTFAAGANTIALEAVGNNFRVIINGVVALSFSNSTVTFFSTATRCGIICHNRGDGDGRVTRFTVYDSISLAPAGPYPIVYFG